MILENVLLSVHGASPRIHRGRAAYKIRRGARPSLSIFDRRDILGLLGRPDRKPSRVIEARGAVFPVVVFPQAQTTATKCIPLDEAHDFFLCMVTFSPNVHL